MSLLGKLFDIAEDIISLPLDAIDDVAGVLEGYKPEGVKKRIQKTGHDVADSIKDLVDGDII